MTEAPHPRAATEAKIQAWISDFGAHSKALTKFAEESVICDGEMSDTGPQYVPSRYGGAGKLRQQITWTGLEYLRIVVEFHTGFWTLEIAHSPLDLSVRSSNFDLEHFERSLFSAAELTGIELEEHHANILMELESDIAKGLALRDDDGTIFYKCGRDSCGLQLVRPGKTQCFCDEVPAEAA